MKELKLFNNIEYQEWVRDLKRRYLAARLRASVNANRELLKYYWSVGKDIFHKQYANTYGSGFFKSLSRDLRAEIPNDKGFSVTNIRYMYHFYMLYHQEVENVLHPVEHSLLDLICSIPWYHQQRIIDKCKENPNKALFFVRKTIEDGWSRDILSNYLTTDLYETQGKGVTNFKSTLPVPQGDLAQQMTKDSYTFNFLTMTEGYVERELEEALVANITKFLLELDTGFAYMGRQFYLPVGSKEFFPDLLFYNTRIHAYCVIELKVTSFKPAYLGQLGFYVSAINHQLKTETDNPTIGLLICRDKDNIVAQYALESTNVPIGISEYQLSKIYPADFKSTLPTIEEIENSLRDKIVSDDKME